MFSHHHASRQLGCSSTWLLSGGLLLGVLLALSQAQVPTAIRPDGTLGTTVTQSGNIYNITGGTRPGNGRNLFHSFDRFSVGTNDTASFSGPAGIENILSRVTGGQQSVIDGRLQSTIPGANLYLLNPSGVLFGPNATLDVSGSFHVSTADYLRFADGAKFSANLGQESVLTVAPPAAFGFLGSNPAAIAIQGSSLQVPGGKALSLVGGDIQLLRSKLVAPSGRIQLASVASPGEVVFSPLELAPELQVDSFTRLGRLELSQGGLLDVSGNGGGTVLIRSGRLLVDRSQILANTLGDVDGTSLGLDLRIAADAVIHDSDLRASLFAAGNGGNIVMNVGSLTLTDGGRLLSSSRGAGRGGTLTVTAADAITITGRNSQGNQSGLFSNAFRLGDAGRVFVSALTLTMDDGQIQAGTIEGSRGNAGGANVQVGRLTLTGGAQIDTSTNGSGRGGELRVMATDTIAIAGHDQEGFPSGLFSVANGSGDAGRLFVSAPTLTMDNGQIQAGTGEGSRGNAGGLEVQVGTLHMDGGRIWANTLGDGNAGNVDVRVGTLTLLGGAQISNSNGATRFINGVPTFIGGQGQGGNLTVVATESISIAGQDSAGFRSGLFSNTNGRGDAGSLLISTPLLSMMDGGRIVTRTLGDGNAGDIEIKTGRLTLTGGAQIFSGIGDFEAGAVRGTQGPGRGGNVTVRATESIFIAGQDSEGFLSAIDSNAQIGRGQAGHIVISTPNLEMRGGFISTGTFNRSTGDAGSIEIRVGRLTLTDSAQISSDTSSGGAAGNIALTTGRLTLTDGAQISSSNRGGIGRGGRLTVTATESITITGQDSEGFRSGLFSNTNGAGDAGGLLVSTPLLSIDGGRIVTRTLGEGNAGDLEIQTGRLTLTGGAQILSGIGRSAGGTVIGTDGPGQGGNITITATEALFMAGQDRDGFLSSISSQALIGRGAAGNIALTTGRLILTDGAQIDGSTQANGRGGNIAIRGQQIDLSKRGTISARSSGKGDAGNIRIQADETFHNQNGAVTTTAEQSGGGQIELRAGRLVHLRDSEVTTSVQGGGGDAGNLTVDAPFIVAGGSQLVAKAFGGRGGNIRINAEVFLADPASRVDASSTLGISGTVDIQAPVTNLSGLVTPLPPEFAPAAALLRDRCAARLREGAVSSFVERGRDGVPANPEGVLPSLLYSGSAGVASPTSETAVSGRRVSRLDDNGHVRGRHWPALKGTALAREPECTAR